MKAPGLGQRTRRQRQLRRLICRVYGHEPGGWFDLYDPMPDPGKLYPGVPPLSNGQQRRCERCGGVEEITFRSVAHD